ncbi:FMN-binding protein [Roseiconus lacunae]|uniref:FMN-binding protein n=1 Tax=Roseiconus lacunae TaxID=2605694 RepID=A0ABT7PGC2_9BACT|nr:FMN-binding protein [Roseiconus lacunae]MDM4015537.1 FMN-binding protein [Roseiconus lacunae]
MRKKFHRLAPLVHCLRVALVIALCVLIPPAHDRGRWAGERMPAPELSIVKRIVPAATRIDADADADGFWGIYDDQDKRLGRAARTMPAAKDVIGYRGPTEALLVIDEQFNLLGTQMLDSGDTEEHVRAVRNDKTFFDQFTRWNWSGPEEPAKIDAVSGATLTSLALAKGVLTRIGGNRGSLVFPDEISIEELSDWFPNAGRVENRDHRVVVFDHQGNELGQVLRSGPYSETIIGYQGPTELLLRLDGRTGQEGQSEPKERSPIVRAIFIRSSFDNQPYVRYCRMERSFWNKFVDRSMAELAATNLEQSGIEGVSGATMTSLAISETIFATADRWADRVRETAERRRMESTLRGRLASWLGDIRFGVTDLACFAMLLTLSILKSRGLFRRRWLRSLWLAASVVVIGLWSGNLISMALIAGWGGEGIAWRLAPALAAIALIAFASPPIGKSNPYCNHLCPHGALQQSLRPKPKSRRRIRLPATLTRVLMVVPGSCLVIAYLLLLFRPSVDLAGWEPFHAYLYRVAPLTSIAFAIATLLFASVVPMGYCRLGCPTGRLLDYLRRSAGSNRVETADGVALALLLVAIATQLA